MSKIKTKIIRVICTLIVFIPALAFVVKFGGPRILTGYIENGIGDCQKIPILCMVPEKDLIYPSINKEHSSELLVYKFPEMSVSLPKGFSVVKEKTKKVYYKRRKDQGKEAVIYLIYEQPDFFINLFPQVKKQGINDNYDFIKCVMQANLKQLNSLNDVFFVIMKSIFTPNLGEQKNLKMITVRATDKRGFINYNLTKERNYFDCNIINDDGDFFKIYIKDIDAKLDLEKVVTIVSTLKSQEGN